MDEVPFVPPYFWLQKGPVAEDDAENADYLLLL